MFVLHVCTLPSVLESGIAAEVVLAVDVNTCANDVYKHNFPNTDVWPKTIEGITLEGFNRLSFDMILMSPPCQPFTRIGLHGDVSDPRAKSFLYILEILPRLLKLPKYILLENVKGFEVSSARDTLLHTLETCGFQFQEFLLSPTCLGIPNSRLRYFLIAKLKPESFYFQSTRQILTTFPHSESGRPQRCCGSGESLKDDSNTVRVEDETTKASPGASSANTSSTQESILYKLETVKELERKQNQDQDVSVRVLKDYLEESIQESSQYLLTPKSLLRYALILDIVKPSCRRSTCFTKGYGHYVEGTGSVLQTAMDVEIDSAFKSLEDLSEEEKLANLSSLKLRYFTPREIANLHGFPASFDFPDKITVRQRYRLLGNSLNVHIVAKLISVLLR
ncbi:tRNA (cytosine(38)-C(5))-methyltransferase isoform X2 [Ambystoma mexicanum]|uniref:tRNA (cytosine(38)-C(5))-methyltransferase isoform X2 n=1 Tax=Ambystoma mexicanum TaxID=8296 RepID=UPI0037E727DF